MSKSKSTAAAYRTAMASGETFDLDWRSPLRLGLEWNRPAEYPDTVITHVASGVSVRETGNGIALLAALVRRLVNVVAGVDTLPAIERDWPEMERNTTNSGDPYEMRPSIHYAPGRGEAPTIALTWFDKDVERMAVDLTAAEAIHTADWLEAHRFMSLHCWAGQGV